jgi:pyruvate formate lyase activating enzyme
MDKLADQASPEQSATKAEELGCESVTFTYNDPTIFFECAIDVAEACRDKDIKTVAVTAGYIPPNPRIEFFNCIDAVNIDLKSFTEPFYTGVCSRHLNDVLETLEYLKHGTEVWFEIITLLIPGKNNSEREINEECEWIVDHLGLSIPLHFATFYPDWKMLDKSNTPSSTVFKAGRIAQEYGLRYVYLGNIHEYNRSSTYCHKCCEMLIDRYWYELSTWNLSPDGECQKCDVKCPGIFGGPPGEWGRRRQAIEI